MSKAKTVVVPDDYLNLVRRVPLRRIRTAVEYKAALAIALELSRKGDERMSEGEVDYLESIARFIQDYERAESGPIKLMPPLAVLKFLMEQHHFGPSELGDVIGSRPAATMILAGDREMSKSQIRKLADYFNVSPALFL